MMAKAVRVSADISYDGCGFWLSEFLHSIYWLLFVSILWCGGVVNKNI
jgi:hypothetical protein